MEWVKFIYLYFYFLNFILFYFFFNSKIEICFEFTKIEISREKAFHAGGKIGKVTLPPPPPKKNPQAAKN